MEVSKQEYWSRLPFPSPGDLPNLGIELQSPHGLQILYRLSQVVKTYIILYQCIFLSNSFSENCLLLGLKQSRQTKTQALQAQVKCCRSQVEDWFPVPPSKDCGARSLAETQDEKAEEADNQHSLSHKLLACDGASTLHRVPKNDDHTKLHKAQISRICWFHLWKLTDRSFSPREYSIGIAISQASNFALFVKKLSQKKKKKKKKKSQHISKNQNVVYWSNKGRYLSLMKYLSPACVIKLFFSHPLP